MRRHFVSLAAIVAIAVGWYVWRQHAIGDTSPLMHASGSAGSANAADANAPAAGAGSAATGKPRRHVRRISAADRAKLAAQIQAAQAARAARAQTGTSATAAAVDDHLHDLDREPTAELDALQESVPFLADCYDNQGSGRPAGSTATAALTLMNDPDIGAVIDPGEITDETGARLPPALDTCLRNTILTLQLPPLTGGGVAKVVYSFKFDGPGR